MSWLATQKASAVAAYQWLRQAEHPVQVVLCSAMFGDLSTHMLMMEGFL